MLADLQAGMPAGGDVMNRFKTSWAKDLAQATRPPEADIAYGVLNYLQLDGAELDDVLQAGGFSNPASRTSGMQSILMPSIFTDYLNRAGQLGSPLRTHLFNKLNRQFNNPLGTVEGYHLMEDFSFVLTTKGPDGKPRQRGRASAVRADAQHREQPAARRHGVRPWWQAGQELPR